MTCCCLWQGGGAAGVQWLERLPQRLAMRLQRLAVCLADDRDDSETLLFEGALDDLEITSEHSPFAGTAALRAQACSCPAALLHSCCLWPI